MSIHHENTHPSSTTKRPRHPLATLGLLILGLAAAYLITAVLF